MKKKGRTARYTVQITKPLIVVVINNDVMNHALHVNHKNKQSLNDTLKLLQNTTINMHTIQYSPFYNLPNPTQKLEILFIYKVSCHKLWAI